MLKLAVALAWVFLRTPVVEAVLDSAAAAVAAALAVVNQHPSAQAWVVLHHCYWVVPAAVAEEEDGVAPWSKDDFLLYLV
jgi:hypothetical protein